ncbi:hypothetical protein MNBD_GAMMA24-1051 [hydrothermal vent metagenome]|uniref:Methyltransferase type 11 domain-containing protein n=1 Tax=hydrothermal vent metagenome TaxID=652676 RepID=A0A3B1C2M5_9ZZZZ
MKAEPEVVTSTCTWLRRLRDRLKYTVIHPQWQANRLHRQSQRILSTIENALVLDVGSGNASYRIAKSNRLVRIDYPETGKHYRNRPDVHADARTLPFATASVDTVFLLEVLEHITDTDQVLTEIKRVLKPGGILYISAPFIYPAHDLPHDYFRFSVEGLQYLLKKQDMQPEIVQRHGNSVVTLLQLGNLVLLESVRCLLERNRLLAAACFFLLYPLCLLNNMFSIPASWFHWPSRLYLGCFIKAVKSRGQRSSV